MNNVALNAKTNASQSKTKESSYIPALQHSPKDSRVPGYGVGIAVERQIIALASPYRRCARADQHARHVQQPRAREQESHDEEPAMGHLVSDVSETFAFYGM